MKRKRILLTLVAALTAPAALLVAQPAAASVSCSFNATSHTITVNAGGNDNSATIGRSGTVFLVNGAACGSETVSTTATIVVNGAAGRQDVKLDLSGGAFGPGFNTDEVKIQLAFGAGTDSLNVSGGPANDKIRAGSAGIDDNGDGDVDVTSTGLEQLLLYGNAGSDTLSAAGANGTGTAYATKVSIYGGDGADTITGGDGNDYILGEGTGDVISGGAGNDTINAGEGKDQLTGGAGDDSMYPGPGNDVANGGDGNDYLGADSTPDGTDSYVGGTGSDQITYYGRTAPLTLSLDGVANDGESGENDNIAADIENISGGNGADTITGSDGNNQLDAGGGPDTLNGLGGDDTLFGGCCDAGADILNGGDGRDSLYGGDGPDALHGGPGNDTPSGGFGNDTVYGDDGNDTLYQEYSAQSDGADNMYGGAGEDVANYASRTANLTITLADNNANDGVVGEKDNVHSDIEEVNGGSGNDLIVGSSLDNTLYGYAGKDTLEGKDGHDVLFGGDNADTLYGGDGEDSMYGENGDDSLAAKDGGTDVVDGGSGTDTILSQDPFDYMFNIP